MAIAFKTAVKKAKGLYKTGRFKKFSDAVRAVYNQSARKPKRKVSGGVAKKSTVARRYKKAVLTVSAKQRAKNGLAKALLDYELADTISATKEAQKRKVKYRRQLKALL